jgi:ParB family chromosome partitioning protein
MAQETLHIAAVIPARQMTRARTWTGDVEWFTPARVLEATVEVMGGIDLDPASSTAAQAHAAVKATRYFTIADNSLEQRWRGRVFLNPPYARSWIDAFVGKMVSAYQAGDMTAGILLTNSSTETDWYHRAAAACEALCFPKRRIRFLKVVDGALTRGSSSPSHPHTFFYFGGDVKRFAQVFGRFGLVLPAPAQAAE